MPYLFVHFREKSTPDGEQVYFGLSRDGFHWEEVNEGRPVLWAYYGDKGVRDFTIIRSEKDQRFYILATDLSLAYGMRNQYHHSWREIAVKGSRNFAFWESEDLVNWSEQRMLSIGTEDFGCMWAPDIIYDRKEENYVIHWSSSHRSDNYEKKRIYYCRTCDFHTFTAPQLLYEKPDSGVIDTAIYEENGKFYMFIKSEENPARVQLMRADQVRGPYETIQDFDESMKSLEEGVYEAPTAMKLESGEWCLFLDFYGVKGSGQGYVPFVSENLDSGIFLRSDKSFSFPYGFKHGTILQISGEEYERIKAHKWEE
ncbi:MAG: glycoside hydrolase family 43 protein [Eubacteriales bacterium]|nr:glycoside hydrolase family 43 protein [Eubacteriales bacterium]